ncbi:MAG: hypothetical protein H0X51_00520 [Parachlamydiaceae bacterium]|nr:hypothetical protein [Parachlamydiaceae bacterium]
METRITGTPEKKTLYSAIVYFAVGGYTSAPAIGVWANAHTPQLGYKA